MSNNHHGRHLAIVEAARKLDEREESIHRAYRVTKHELKLSYHQAMKAAAQAYKDEITAIEARYGG